LASKGKRRKDLETSAAEELIREWLGRQLPQDPFDWLQEGLGSVIETPDDRKFDIIFGSIPRKLGKGDLELSRADVSKAEGARHGWNPANWSIDIAARVLLLSMVSRVSDFNFAKKFSELHRTADLGEAVALFLGLPLYRGGDRLIDTVAVGLRTNVKAEFKAIAHRNPYPLEVFSENTWNNMILKALFIGVSLHPIEGLDKRANSDLARILTDYAHERWAAGRSVSPELWRCIGPFADNGMLADLDHVLTNGTETEKFAAALALKTSPNCKLRDEILARYSSLVSKLKAKKISWKTIHQSMLNRKEGATRMLNYEVEMSKNG
jgi:hypothetical protein